MGALSIAATLLKYGNLEVFTTLIVFVSYTKLIDLKFFIVRILAVEMNKKNRFNLVSLFILEQMQFLPKKTP